MRYLTRALILAAGLWAVPAMADEPNDGDKGDRPAKGEMREKMLKQFDKDGDGKLSDDEREKMREKHGKGKKGGAADAGKKQGKKREKGVGEFRAPRDKRGPGDGPRPDGSPGRRGPGGPMGGPPIPPEEMFEKFDADKNDSLSRDEFKKMTQFIHEHRPMGPRPGGPEGRRDFRGPRDGEGPREFRREGGPRGDRPGPPDFERRRGDRDRDREGRPDRPSRDRDRDDGEKAEKAEDESV